MTVDPQTTEREGWESWKSTLLMCADNAGWHRGNVETEAYRDYFEDGYSAQDAWDEDMQHGY